MGAVFEGIHGETQHRVAIKVLLQHLSAQPEVVRRFFNEARAARMIAHPAVVEVYDVGILPDGGAYMVMEYSRARRCARASSASRAARRRRAADRRATSPPR